MDHDNDQKQNGNSIQERDSPSVFDISSVLREINTMCNALESNRASGLERPMSNVPVTLVIPNAGLNSLITISVKDGVE